MYTNALDTNLLIESYSSNGLCLEGYYGGKPSTIAGLYAKGCTIIDRGNKKIWQNVGDCDNVVWFDVTSGGVSSINGITDAVTLSAGNNISLNQVGNDIQFNANFTQTGKYMISGGAIWSGTGLTYNVSIISYFFNGFKTGSQTNVTLDPSDPLENRLDAIVVDEAGVVSVITGDPSASPVTPPIPEDQLLVQYIIVIAGSTEPVVVQDAIYLDDPTSNWTFSTYNTATPATGTINFAGTNSPKQGINDIEASTDLRKGARFVRSTSFDAYQYTMFSVWVRFTGTAVATNKALNVRFENSAGTLVGNTVNLFSYGLSRSILNTWQLVVIPITAFGNLPATVKGLKVIMAGGTVGAVRQWDIDYMILTNGSIPSANVPTIAFYRNGTGIASQTGLNIIQGTGMTITAANDPTNGRVNYTFNAAGGSPAGSDTQIQYNNAGAFGASSNFTFDQATNSFTATNSWEVFRSEIKFESNGGPDDLSASPVSSFTGTPPTVFYVLAFGNIQIVNYTNLVGGNFSQGDIITGSISGAQGSVAYDDGSGQLYVSITNSIQFASGDVIDNGNGVTADYDTSTTSNDVFSWFSSNGGSGGPTVITGSSQTLNDGISITFGSTTGHGVGDSWNWSYKTLKNTLLTNRIFGAGALGGAINGQYFKSGSGSSIIQSMSGFLQNGYDDRIFPLSYYEDLTSGNNSDKERAYYGLSPFKNDPAEPLEFTVYTRKGLGPGPGTSDISTFSVSSLNGIRMESDKIVYIDSPLFIAAEQLFSWIGNTNSTGITIDDVNYLFGYSSGIIRGNAFHNNGNVAQGDATQQDVRSGTYTPTLTNVTNITTSTAYKFQWMRVGNVVTVSGRVNIQNTATGASELGISLPIASDIGATTDCVGSAPGSTSGILDDVGWVIGDATNNRAAMQSTAVGTGAHDHWVSFTYEVK